jgi:hypothetical protein
MGQTVSCCICFIASKQYNKKDKVGQKSVCCRSHSHSKAASQLTCHLLIPGVVCEEYESFHVPHCLEQPQLPSSVSRLGVFGHLQDRAGIVRMKREL